MGVNIKSWLKHFLWFILSLDNLLQATPLPYSYFDPYSSNVANLGLTGKEENEFL